MFPCISYCIVALVWQYNCVDNVKVFTMWNCYFMSKLKLKYCVVCCKYHTCHIRRWLYLIVIFECRISNIQPTWQMSHSHAFSREHLTRILKFILEATSISSTVHLRRPDNVGGWCCWFKEIAKTIIGLLKTLDFVNFGGFRGFRFLDPPIKVLKEKRKSKECPEIFVRVVGAGITFRF